jgi:hypothetical protein
MKRLSVIFVILFTTFSINAQDETDVLRLSQNINLGTARFVSMGGAYGALGADFTTLSYNPAGLGVYRSSEFTITPTLKNRISNTNYLNSAYSDRRTRFMFDNIGLVSSFKMLKEEEKGLLMINLGIGYNRINDFYGESTALGDNQVQSITDYFASLANKANADGWDWYDISADNTWDPYKKTGAPWAAILAWNAYLIDTVPGNSNYYQPFLMEGDGVHQDQTISSEGGVGEFTFSLGANFSNKLYAGATVGVQNVYFKQTIYYSENAFSNNLPLPNGDLFKSLDYNQELLVEGSGVNFKVGLIYRPMPEIRLGFAAHTPTFYNLSERYSATMSSVLNFGRYDSETPINIYDYKIESPYKLIGSLAYTFGSIGLVSVDYEYIDYTSMRFVKGGDGDRFINENNQIKSMFTNTFNLKAGGEIWIGQLALRGGYAYYGSPYINSTNLSSGETNVFSGGFGLRLPNMFIDWAYQRYMFSDKYTMYMFTDAPIVSRSITQNKFLFTVGFRF